MNADVPILSTGLPGLDEVLNGLRPGDNVVWQVDDLGDYRPVIGPLVGEAGRLGRPLVYFHFARHEPLLDASSGARVHALDPQEGFDRFLTRILDLIEEAGRGAYYVFDNLSDLAADWFSDRMLGSFFRIACPYLYELDTVAYFALQKHAHSVHATQSIFDTAQVIIDVYRQHDQRYIHPLKVWERHTPTMYTLHQWDGDVFRPVTRSATITDILASMPKPWLEFTIRRPGLWARAFREAQQAMPEPGAPRPPTRESEALFERLMAMVASRDARFQKLVRRHFSLEDLVQIMQRMVGTGLIGGKSLGMLLARAILRGASPRWPQVLESHDSFYVGSDVFYTYLVRNGCWWLRRRHRDFDVCLERAAQARERILAGTFPEDVLHQFTEMLDYFGQSPLIVRSSSLLEDNYGNAFSGKYESVFCVNQGTRQERLAALLNAVRTVYASDLSEESLRYRHHHGLLDRDEQMALLIQRVSGELHGGLFFPHVAGVGFSFNPFVWHEDIQAEAGLLRLVFGLGTRAVDRADDDYTRLVALNAPLKCPESRADHQREFTQRRVDVLDTRANALLSRDFEEVARLCPGPMLAWFGRWEDGRLSDPRPMAPTAEFRGYLDFDRLFSETDFVPTMRVLCRTLQEAYDCPVDIEFTANFNPQGGFRINLLQCRPFQVRIGGEAGRVKVPEILEPARLVLRTRGPIVGHGVATAIDRVLYVKPSAYSQLGMSRRYSVARAVGRLTHLGDPQERPVILILGPGRWGTTMPALGVPVSFAEINTVSVICELAVMHENLTPEVSLGTHFFNDLVEMDMLYLALSPGRPGHEFHEASLLARPNRLADLLPSAAGLADVIHVVDAGAEPAGGSLLLNVDPLRQTGVCYWTGA
ncbi:MAG TPA: PEP/pyruvate-binding domain-containing protein [Verrucomicrobiota bacterium]|nr:PEP/pyruvate-binding domain-containing protein [Verrucomicrobiota bacterium]HNU50480.1 PEP/pyruvate-binding domain-containing protein [Verrucomicrobiota bacterium]